MAGEYSWSAWTTTTGIDAAAVTTEGTDVTEEISNHLKLATEVSIEIAYGATATVGCVVSVLREYSAAVFEATADLPFAFSMPFAVSTTFRRTITIPAMISDFQVHIANDSGATVTATARYRQATVAE